MNNRSEKSDLSNLLNGYIYDLIVIYLIYKLNRPKFPTELHISLDRILINNTVLIANKVYELFGPSSKLISGLEDPYLSAWKNWKKKMESNGWIDLRNYFTAHPMDKQGTVPNFEEIDKLAKRVINGDLDSFLNKITTRPAIKYDHETLVGVLEKIRDQLPI